MQGRRPLPRTTTITASVTRGNDTRPAYARLTVNEPVTRGCPPSSPTWVGLPLCEEYPRVGYDRDAFGSGYSSLEDEIIAGLPQVDSAKVYTPYTCTLFDIRVDGTAATDIEHIVALAEAYDSGLPESLFREFASDIDNLTIARPDVNRNQKSDRDAGEWRPARSQGWFANRVIAVKQKYALSVDSSERDALKSMLDSLRSLGSPDTGRDAASSRAAVHRVRRLLFMPTPVAVQHNPDLKRKYEALARSRANARRRSL